MLHNAALLGDIDHLAQLDFGGERAIAEATTRGDDVAEPNQQLFQWPQHLGHKTQNDRGGKGNRVWILPTHRAGKHPEDQEGEQSQQHHCSHNGPALRLEKLKTDRRKRHCTD